MAFRSQKYTYIGKKIYFRQTNVDLDQKHCLFPCKFADLRFADWDTKEICGLLLQNEAKNLRICNLRFNRKICMSIFA
jgi:hypothetical protein